MKATFILIFCSLLFIQCTDDTNNKPTEETPKIGLMIIDAQKWFIPGHKESLYTLWDITGHDRKADELVPAMDTVLSWANSKSFPVFVTYEGSDTGRYDLPKTLLNHLDSNNTFHYVKLFYGAPKHADFNKKIKDSNIKNWIVIGAETDVCVYQTVKELLKQDLKVTLIKDAVYSGRNNTEVSFDNLKKYGANVITLAELRNNKTLFINKKPKVEPALSYENTLLTVLSTDDTLNQNSGTVKRLNYLTQYAEIIGLPIERINEKEENIATANKVRLVAGNITDEQYAQLQKQTSDHLIIVSDCSTGLTFSELPKSWKKTTLKIAFYELMETAEFYAKTPNELQGWQKQLKKAMDDQQLDYVESTQNL